MEKERQRESRNECEDEVEGSEIRVSCGYDDNVDDDDNAYSIILSQSRESVLSSDISYFTEKERESKERAPKGKELSRRRGENY